MIRMSRVDRLPLPPATAYRRDVEAALKLFTDLLGDYRPRDFAVRLWDGTTWHADPGQLTRYTLVIKHPGALRRIFLAPSDLTLGEAYIFDDFDVEGDLEAAFGLGEYLLERPSGLAERLRYGALLLRAAGESKGRSARPGARLRGSRHSRHRDHQAISYHYNISNDFYALWLDERMVYTCAYFESAADDLATAQRRKLDHVCRKLRLQPGERLLDLGCGWGGLVIHAAEHYGVRAFGVTLSRAQAELAQERIARLGLQGQCRVENLDYREVDDPDGFDKLACVGMFEHVGEARLLDCLKRAHRLMRPGGVFLNHGIARGYHFPVQPEPSFISRYVFPDGELVPVSTTLVAAENAGFEVRDVESLREHYTLTLRHWVRGLETHHDEAIRLTDEVTYRIWKLYMAGSAHGFSTGRLNLYQMLLAKPAHGRCGLPLTRADWYT